MEETKNPYKPTDLHLYMEILQRANVPHSLVEEEVKASKGEHIYEDVRYDYKYAINIDVPAGSSDEKLTFEGDLNRIHGYMGFGCRHLFDKDGDLVTVEIWE